MSLATARETRLDTIATRKTGAACASKITSRALAIALSALAFLVVACSSGDDGPTRIALTGDSTYPEGILATSDGTMFVSGFGDGSIHRIDRPDRSESSDGQDRASVFRAAGADSRGAAVGMAIDEERDRLWVARFDFGSMTSALQAFDPGSAAMKLELTAQGSDVPHFFNELALAGDGRVFISDTLGPRIWLADPAAGTIDVFVENSLLANAFGQPFGLNGLALTPDGRWLVASVMDRLDQGDGRLVRIDRETREVVDVALRGDAVAIFGGSDGMMFLPSGELLMVNVTPPSAIVTARFSSDYSEAELVQRRALDAALRRPTAPALRDGTLFVVSSQLDHIIDDENGALGTPPILPFEIVGMKLDAVVGK